MNQFIILSLLIICLIYVFHQVHAAPADTKETAESMGSSTAQEIEKAWDSVKQTFEKGFEQIKPNLEKFGEDTKQFFNNAADTISKEAQKIIPKTD